VGTFFCGDASNANALAETEPLRVSFYKAVATFVRAYADIAQNLTAAGYSDAEAAALRTEVEFYSDTRSSVDACPAGAGATGRAIRGRGRCRMHGGKNRGPLPGNSPAITRGRYPAAAVDRLAPPRHRPVPPRLPLLALSPPLIVRLPPPSGAARPKRSRKTPIRPVSSPGPRQRAHAPADTGGRRHPDRQTRSAPASSWARVDSPPELGRNSFYTGAIREVGSRRES
jgi:hypothetical protein